MRIFTIKLKQYKEVEFNVEAKTLIKAKIILAKYLNLNPLLFANQIESIKTTTKLTNNN